MGGTVSKMRTKEDASVKITVTKSSCGTWIRIARGSKDGFEYFGSEHYTIDEARQLSPQLIEKLKEL